jgi:ribosomal RNA-processing protein 8
MPQLFDVPGWSVAEPTASGSKSEKSSKKRKRPTSDTSSKLLSAELNLEKLMDKLRESTKPDQGQKAESSSKFSLGKSKKGKKQSQDKSKSQPEVPLAREISLPKPLQPTGRLSKEKRRSFQDSRPEKRQKVRHSVDAPQALPPPRTQSKSASPDSEANLTVMQKSMRASLEGAKFRYVNRLTSTAQV